MNRRSGGQSSHKTGDDREPTLAPGWKYIPTAVLREFTIDLVARHKLRGVARMVGLAKDTVRKFVNGISQPTFSTRRKLGELFLELYPGGTMTQPLADGEKKWKLRPRLIELLPQGEGNARAAVSLIFQVARLFPQEVPKNIAQIEEWMDLQVRGEYWAERHYGEIARQANAQGDAAAAGRGRKPRRKSGDAADGDE